MTVTVRDSKPKTVPLGDLVTDVKPGFAVGERAPPGVIQVRMNNVDTEGHLDLESVIRVPATDRQIADCSLTVGDVLFNNTNSTELVGKSAVFRGHTEPVTFSNHFTRLRVNPKKLDPFYLGRWLTRQQQCRVFEGLCTRWVGQSAVRTEKLLALSIPLPPLSEQKRIADILDKADVIRRKRHESLRLCGEFRRSQFLKLFGDPAVNQKSFTTTTLGDVCGGDLRNGVSPSRRGSVRGKVLVLSAITGPAFDPSAVKEGMFDNPFKPEQLVEEGEFLICRGNGNLALCGTGRFATRSFHDTVFPDTMIAARVDLMQVCPGYLEELWRTRHVRGQIEASARTTSGIYKINQKTLSQISFPLPPIEQQGQFEDAIGRMAGIQQRLQGPLVDDLFNSLVQRAFRGSLSLIGSLPGDKHKCPT